MTSSYQILKSNFKRKKNKTLTKFNDLEERIKNIQKIFEFEEPVIEKLYVRTNKVSIYEIKGTAESIRRLTRARDCQNSLRASGLRSYLSTGPSLRFTTERPGRKHRKPTEIPAAFPAHTSSLPQSSFILNLQY